MCFFDEPRFLALQCQNCKESIYIEPENDQRIDESGIVHALCLRCGKDIEVGRVSSVDSD